MKVSTPFDPDADLIIVEAKLSGPRGSISIKMALDTAAVGTLVIPDVLDEIGYSARDGTRLTSVTSAVATEHGFLLKVAEIEALGFVIGSLPVNIFELPDGFGIAGLLGLNFLRHFNYEIRSTDCWIVAERI